MVFIAEEQSGWRKSCEFEFDGSIYIQNYKKTGAFDKDNVLEHMSNKESLLCDISLLYQRTTQILDSYSYSVLRANTFDLQESYKILQASLVQVGLLRQIRIS